MNTFAMTRMFELQQMCGRFDRSEISFTEFVDGCCRYMGRTIDSTRAGIWLFEGECDDDLPMLMRCLGIYDQRFDKVCLAPPESRAAAGRYFEALSRDGHVIADDAQTHPATAGFFYGKRAGFGVTALMATAFSLNGRLLGAFTCTQIGPPEPWTRLQLAELRAITGRVSLALVRASAVNTATEPMPL